MHRLVEAELDLELLDEFGVEPLGAAVLEVCRLIRPAQDLALAAAGFAAFAAADPRRGVDIGALDLRDDALDRPAGSELDDGEGHQHDPEQGRDHQQQAFEDVGSHTREMRARRVLELGRRGPSLAAFQASGLGRVGPPGFDDAALVFGLDLRPVELVPVGDVVGALVSSAAPRSARRAAPGRAPGRPPSVPRGRSAG